MSITLQKYNCLLFIAGFTSRALLSENHIGFVGMSYAGFKHLLISYGDFIVAARS